MKKFIYTLGMASFAFGAIAQPSALKNQIIQAERTIQLATPTPKPADNVTQTTRDGEIFVSDFSDPSAWVIDNNGTPSTNWVIGTAAPIGFFSLGMGAIQSTSGGNFAMFDSDGLGSSEADIQNAWIQIAEPLDLSENDFVAMEFESYYRAFVGACFVDASTDGVEWTSFPVHTDIAVNSSTANPETVFVNLSSVLGNAPQAWFRFRYEGGWDYAWMVDDVTLIAPFDNDMAMVAAWYGNSILTDLAAETLQDIETWDDHAYQAGMEYTHYPVGQVRPMNFVAFAVNNGTQAQTNVQLSATVTTPSGVEGPFTSAMGVTVEPGEEVLFTIDNVVPDAFAGGGEIGQYTVSFEIVADQADDNPGNNMEDDKQFNVTTDEFANDDPNNSATSLPLTQNRILGTRYAFVEPATITHLKFALFNSATVPTQEGELCYPNVRAASVIQPGGPNNPETPVFNDTEIEYVVEMDEVNQGPISGEVNYIIVELPSEVAAGIDRVYQAEISFPQNVDGDLIALLGTSGRETFAGVVRNFNAAASTYGQGWFALGNLVPNIRFATLGVVSTNSVDALKFNMSQNYPNPSYGQTTIDWELLVPAQNVRFSITDLTGRTVYAKDLGDRPAGKQEPLIIDLSRFAAGNYQYGLTIGNERLVKKMVIVK